ncbi:hypothetical protein LguiB_023502 [Lonicera macranthoides]
MAVASETVETIIDSSGRSSMEKSHSTKLSSSDYPSSSSSFVNGGTGTTSFLPDPPNSDNNNNNCTPIDHHHQSPYSSLSQSQLDNQDQTSLRSEEYRQLFRLPPDEALIQDFNCACQESFLMQGHMYLFVHYICFYSNLFGYETKKIIPFEEVTSVKRAKTAAIFPTAIEIIAAGKKYLFTSFLSRDEAFKLLSDGWMEHGNGTKAIMDQELRPELSRQETGVVILEPRINKAKTGVSLTSPHTIYTYNSHLGLTDKPYIHSLITINHMLSNNTMSREVEVSDAPKVPEDYTVVAESKFPINVEKFFNIFFSDNAVDFLQSFHQKCGDKEFKCSSWYVHNEFGHARDVSFQHPIKIYFGTKFGSCQEIQKYRFYGNSHLAVDTSQEIIDVLYGDYFRVEGLWHVERDGDESKECCTLRVYTNVAFSKKTIWKGKIVQNTVDECRETYALWIELAHEFLQQKNLEKEAANRATDLVKSAQHPLELVAETADRSDKRTRLGKTETLPDSKINQVIMPLRGIIGSGAAAATSFLKDYVGKFRFLVKSQSQLPSLAVIVVAFIILLMQCLRVLMIRRNIYHVVDTPIHPSAPDQPLSDTSHEQVSKWRHGLKASKILVSTRTLPMMNHHLALNLMMKKLVHGM